MQTKGLSPGVQNGQEAKLCAEMPGIGSDFEQRGGAGFEQQGKELPLVLPHQRHKHMWNAEDQVVVADGQQFQLSLGQPPIAAPVWHFGQCRLRQELYEMASMSATHALRHDDHRGQRYGSERSRQALCVAARLTKRGTVAGSCRH